MKIFVLKTYGKIVAWVLTALGLYTSCHISGPAEYGTPHADFVVKGNVSDKSSRQPIGNMPVISKSLVYPYENDTVRTDAGGNYELEYTGFSKSEGITVYTSDIDNGAYLSDTIRINASELKQIKKGKNWYGGKFEGRADFQLTRDTTVPTHETGSTGYKEEEE